MKLLKKAMDQQVQHWRILNKSLPDLKQEKTGYYEISVYKGELTPVCLAENVVKIKKAFPILPKEFFDVLEERIFENGFSNERLIDAVNNAIDNCIFPTPTIAQFIGYDKKIKLYTYNQVLEMNQELSGKAFNFYKAVKVQEGQKTPVYVHVNDVEKYNLEGWKDEK